MVKKAQDNVKERIPQEAMALAAEIGWAHVSLREVAEKCGLSMVELYEYVEDKTDILVLFGRMIDRQVLEAVDEVDLDVSERDRLFDILMERFDTLGPYRAGLVSVLESFCFDPKQAVISAPHLARSMSWMLEAAGIETSGVRGALKVAGLTALYLKALRVWRTDESVDLAKVMAALDKDLGRVETLALRFGI